MMMKYRPWDVDVEPCDFGPDCIYDHFDTFAEAIEYAHGKVS